jgi:hypothetical protein
MDVTYNDIIETLLSGDIGQYVPEGIAHSFPVIGREEETIVDCFFLFSYCYGKPMFNSPFARIAIDPYSRKLVYYYDSKTKPFGTEMESQSFPLEFDHSKDERREALKRYEELYVLVREFAFTNDLDAKQVSVLVEYMKTFDILVAVEMKPFYVALSPEFFALVTKALKPN